MSRAPYLVALAVLVLNDHVLKHAFPGFITGKLSDFAGVFVLAIFLALLFPRSVACVVAGLVFVFWKSPWSDPLIAALPWHPERVIDWTDLSALVMLPFANRVRTPVEPRKPAHVWIAILSLGAFAATSPARSEVAIPEGHELRNFATGRTLTEVVRSQKRCGMMVTIGRERIDVAMYWKRFQLLGHNPEVDVFGTAEIVDGKVWLHFERIDVRWESKADAESYRADLLKRLRRCFDPGTSR